MTAETGMNENTRPGKPESRVLRRSGTNELLPDLACKRISIVNVLFFGADQSPDRTWVLIDAGMPGTARLILRAAEKRYGRDSRPAAILLTHGHFDHVGALKKLADFWDVPIYAHKEEFPYLEGSRQYPPPARQAGMGLMAALALAPRSPLDVREHLRELPQDEVPFMPGWRWIATPGHSPGHVSFWRESDRTLIAGDAFITTRQESAYSVAVQTPEINGPPSDYTPDWEAARKSVQTLADLEPERVITGHGPPMQGAELREALKQLAPGLDHAGAQEAGHYVSKAA